MSNFNKRVQVNKIIESQLPEFITADFPKAVEFFKQYYISQEHQGGNVDLAENLDQYLQLDNLTPDVITGLTTTSSAVQSSDTTINVESTKGFPKEWGLLKIDDEIITYTGITATSFTGCVRGFSGITGYNVGIGSDLNHINKENLVFADTTAVGHATNVTVTNLSALFLQEFYKKLKVSLTPGLENNTFTAGLDVSNFIKSARAFYQAKGIAESIRILFVVLYGKDANILDLEQYLLKPSAADFIRREVIVAELISGEPSNLVGQTVYKSTDLGTSGSVSEVEIITRENAPYYKLSLFVGYSERDLIEGTFTVPGQSKSIESVSVGSSIISVDSTIGFGHTGTVVSGTNVIDYTGKSVNQFLGCSNITTDIVIGDKIRSNEVIFGYENGDSAKKVELRITGVLSKFVPGGHISLSDEKEEITVKNIGEIIENPTEDKTYKEVFANSWMYNTSSRYQIQTISGSTFTLSSPIDKSSLRKGDKVDILVRDTLNVGTVGISTWGKADAIVATVDLNTNQIYLDNITGWINPKSAHNLNINFDIVRRVKKAYSTTGVELFYGNNNILSDVLNVYTDGQETEFGYVASNSLPSYDIKKDQESSSDPTNLIVESTIPQGQVPYLQGFNTTSQRYHIISFTDNVDFVDGDVVLYRPSGDPLPGLISGSRYYVDVINNSSIVLYSSLSQIFSTQYVEFDRGTGSHTFILERHKNKKLTANRILRKFPLSQNLVTKKVSETKRGSLGLLVDGVEIVSPKSVDKIYYGPINKFDVMNGGKDYDVVNPPKITIASPLVSSGTTALVEPIITGTVKEVFIDPQDFDIDEVISLDIVGGNGSGCLLEPILGARFRELEFDSRDIFFGGGIDPTDETITFKKVHNLQEGEPILYNRNGNTAVGIGSYQSVNNTIDGYLGDGDQYHVKVINTRTVKLHKTYVDATANNNLGINTIGLSTSSLSSGIHKFRTLSKNTIRGIKVLKPGSGYEHRKLYVNTVGIATIYDIINKENHGFNEGDVVQYSTTGTAISGLTESTGITSTTVHYKVIKLDNDSFRLADTGIGNTTTDRYDRKNYVNFGSTGSGYHIFGYPKVEVNVNVSYGSTVRGEFNFTPVVTGQITGGYMYEGGTGYGSTILNLHKKPIITLTNGKEAQLNPIIVNGKIEDVQVLNKGYEYSSLPTLTITGAGSGAVLRPVIVNEKITDVVVINPGIGYSATDTDIHVDPRGSGALFEARVRDLTVNEINRFGQYSLSELPVEDPIADNLSYNIIGYSENLAKKASYEPNLRGSGYTDGHSPIIGWAYDGNPIYGPYGYADSNDVQSGVRILQSGYKVDTSKIIDRPSGFADGEFIEDYTFTTSGQLDEHNGRYCKTPDFPTGIYAYFAGVTTSTTTNKLDPQYPYFIGNTYRSDLIEENLTLLQDFDFNNSTLSRNTFPYKAGDEYADNDFILESNETIDQRSVIESVTKGEVDSVEVLDGGSGYRIGDYTDFDDTGTKGTGLKAQVSELIGIGISRIETSLTRYDNSVFVWESNKRVTAHQFPNSIFEDTDTVLVSGLSTSVTYLPGSFKVGVSTSVVGLDKTMTENTDTVYPTIEDIYVSEIPRSVSIGSSIKIGNEILKVLNVYPLGSIMRTKRYPHYAGSTGHNNPGIAHTYGSPVGTLVDQVSIPVETESFESKLNYKVYFNARESVGVGTTSGGVISKNYTVGETTKTVSIPCRTIYLPDHPFKTGDKLTLSRKDTNATALIVGEGPTVTPHPTYQLPNLTTNQTTVYAINKGRDYIGLTTGIMNGQAISAGSTSDGLYFHGDGSNNYEYLLETNYDQVTGTVERVTSTITTKVSVGSTEVHGLQNNDQVKLTLIPNTTVGIGTTAACSVHYDSINSKLLINPIEVTFSAIASADSITIDNHRLNTGDKVYYETVSGNTPTGLTNRSSYFVRRVTDRIFKLAPTWDDARLDENIVSFTTAPTSVNKFSLINPPIKVVRNSNLTFGLSTSTLTGFEFKIFHDSEFKNEFLSSNDSSEFNVIGVGTVGVGKTSSLSINYSKNLPTKLYYALEKGGYISTADIDVKNYSEIQFVDSEYSGTYKVSEVTTNSFQISPSSVPDVLTYTEDQCDKIEYSTKSLNVTGKVKDVKILSKGFNYKKLPKFVSIGSTAGKNANLVAISTSIGKIKDVRIIDFGYEYSSDKTLRPEAFVAPIIRVDNLDTVSSIDIPNGGTNYLRAPDLILWNPNTNTVVDNSSLIAEVPNTTISNIKVLAPINGLESVTHKCIAINNSNGIGIHSMWTTQASGIVTCILDTPILGFSSAPFKVGDRIYVEGIELADETSGSGYNSSDYNHVFFDVIDYANTNRAVLEYSIAGLTTNPGIAKTFQGGYANIINENVYPTFNVIQKRGSFNNNEQVYVDIGSGYLERDLYVTASREDFIKVKGSYTTYLKVGDRIKGVISGVESTITNIQKNAAKFEVDYSNRQDYGWLDNIGKLSEDIQVIPDNHYYQNLSYSVQSPIEWEKFVDPINRVVHPVGLKNFADTSVDSVVDVGVSYGATTHNVVILDVQGERRVDTINNFDTVVDYDSRENKSKYIQFKNTKLTNYNKCLTNRVLVHDDISPKFSSKGDQDLFTEVEEIIGNYARYLIQIIDPDTLDTQVTDLVVSTTTYDAILFERSSIYTNKKLGDFSAEVDSFQRKTLIFTPTEKYEKDHDIKILKSVFNTTLVGDGTKSIGSIDLRSCNVGVGSTTVGFTTSTIASYATSDFNALFASVQIKDEITRDLNYLDVLLDYDGRGNISIADYYSDSKSHAKPDQIGIITAVYDSNVGIVSLTCENERDTALTVRANLVGLGTITAGLGTYRFLTPGQPAGAERSARLESINNVGVTTVEVYRGLIENDNAVKSLVRVSCGQTSALHQVTLVQDKINYHVMQGPIVSIGSTLGNIGIGTFGAVGVGNTVSLNFYADAEFVSNVQVQAYNEVLYRSNDFVNEAPELTYGTLTQDLFLDSYDGVNGNRANKVDFDLTHEGTPIYNKTFNPGDSTQLDPVTGIFTIDNHFFNNGEELTYTPSSTFIGIGSTSVGIGTTTNSVGVNTDLLPKTVYPYVLNASQFKLVTRKEYLKVLPSGETILSGSAVTFTNAGEGNAHILEMTKKVEKAVIGLDGIVQQPVTYTKVNHTLEGNIGVGNTFALSGISTLQPRDVLKVDDEYMKVIKVGFGTDASTSSSIITGWASTIPIVEVDRGALGTGVTSHVNGSNVTVNRGSFNIIGSKVWFLDPPKGNTRERRSVTNLPYVRAEYSGRTFLRSNYDTNMLFDDISNDFTGIGRTYSLSVGGADTTGVSVGNGILFINGVFQTPITQNNAGNNYEMEEDTVAGISSVIFTGITSVDGSYIKSDFDINQNQLPRGGLIVSLGSTPGLGYAPLEGAAVMPKINAAGTITEIVGVGTTGAPQGISSATYDHTSGILEVTTGSFHGFEGGERVKLEGLNFECYYGTKTYPNHTRSLDITGIVSATTFNVNVGTSTVSHTYQGIVGSGTTNPVVIEHHSLTFGSGYSGQVAIGVTDEKYDHKFVQNDQVGIIKQTAGPQPANNIPTDAIYESETGLLTLVIGSPTNLVAGNLIRIPNNSLKFTCSRDNHATVHTYPRATDPAGNNTNLAVVSTTDTTITVGVGSGGGSGRGTNITAEAAYNTHTYVAADSTLTNAISITGGANITPDSVSYNPETGILLVNKSGLSGLTIQTTKNIANTADGVVYDPIAGIATIKTTTSHGFSNGDKIKIEDKSIPLTCGLDGNNSVHYYPRPTDPVSGKWLSATVVNTTKFSVDVGKSPHTTPHTFVTGTGTLTGAIRKSNSSVGIATDAFAFTCAQDNHASIHKYPRTSDPAHRAVMPVGQVTANTSFEVFVGKAPTGTGGVLKFNITDGGEGFINPRIDVPQPVYEAVPVVGVSRIGLGQTTTTGNNLTLNLKIDASPLTLVGDRFGDAANLIKDNAQLIGEVAVGRMLDEYPSFQIASGAAGYNNQDCIDDIKDVLDSVNWNLQFGGNDRTVDTARLYVTDDHVQGEEQESIYAMKQAANLAVDVMQNKPVTLGAQHNHTFVSATAGAAYTGGQYIHTFVAGSENTNAIAVNSWAGTKITPTGATYNATTGDLVLTVPSGHGVTNSNTIGIATNSLTFTCDRDNNATEHTYPRSTDPVHNIATIPVKSTSGTSITVNVGISTIVERNVSAATYDAVTGDLVVTSAGHGYTPPSAHTATGAVYDPIAGITTLTVANHGFSTGERVLINDGSLIFTCARDSHASAHSYPRTTDPVSKKWLPITVVDSNSFKVTVGVSQDPSAHTFVSAHSNGILRELGKVGIATNSLRFTCDLDNNIAQKTYPRTTDPYHNTTLGIRTTTSNTFTVNVGSSQTTYITTNSLTQKFDGSITVDGTKHKVTDASYDPDSGIMGLTVNNHLFSNGDMVKLSDNSIRFTCDKDNNVGIHTYPRNIPGISDPVSQSYLKISDVVSDSIAGIATFNVNVGKSPVTEYTPTSAVYDPIVGIVTMTVGSHDIQQGDVVRIKPYSLTFSCTQGSGNHSYPRTTDPAYKASVTVTGVTATEVSVQVLASQPSTNVTPHTFVKASTGALTVGQYEHTFVSADDNSVLRQSSTGCANVASAIHTLVGIVTTGIGHTVLPTRTLSNPSLYNVKEFEVARSGHSFNIGDKFQPVGLVTAQGLIKPKSEFELEVIETFNDFFAAWQFGQIDMIDNIKFMQNGSRKRFPLFYNDELLSFEIDKTHPLSTEIDLHSVLVIFVNGVLQTPGYSYQFDGGATFTFLEPPRAQDKVDVFFYVGQAGVDTLNVPVNETLKPGDDVRILKHPSLSDTVDQEKERIIIELTGSDILETNTYVGIGITEDTYKPLEWTKQKRDYHIRGEIISKARESIESLVFPVAHVIQDFDHNDTSIFVDDIQHLNYEENKYNNTMTGWDTLIIPGSDPISAAFTATVSAAGTIKEFHIDNVGSGYSVSSIPISVSRPKFIGVGIGTTASGTATITNGSVSSVTVTNPGLGYSWFTPQVIAPSPNFDTELVTGIENVQGWTGIITGIGTTTGTGNHPLALKFFYRSDQADASDLANLHGTGQQCSVVVNETRIGAPVTSVDTGGNSSIVGIGTTALDNVYKVHTINNFAGTRDGYLTSNIDSSWTIPSSLVGIGSTGSETMPLGRISWGRIYNYTRSSNPISIGITGLTWTPPGSNAGLSTYPLVQRRNIGIRSTGAITEESEIYNP